MYIRGAGLPEATGIFSRFVVRFPTRAYQRFFTQQVAHAAARRVFSARTVVSARQLDRFPTGQAAQQFASERRLASVRRQAADCDNDWAISLHEVTEASRMRTRVSSPAASSPSNREGRGLSRSS